MPVFPWMANRLILCPSTNFIDAGEKERVEIPVGCGHVEAWVGKHNVEPNSDRHKLTIIKFPGTSGRAERAGVHPAEVWPNVSAEVWTVNQFGYGGSSKPASIQSFPQTAATIYDFVAKRYPQRPTIVSGNSLGCVSALFLAARFDVAAMILRNPPPLHQMIRTRPKYSWWNFGLARWIANEIPLELDSVENAKRSSTRCLFVQSEKDTVVPTSYQSQIIDSYSGEKRVFQIDGANHADLVNEHQQADYQSAIKWLSVPFT